MIRQHTRSLHADIVRLAGSMPARDLARELGCRYSTLRTIASAHRISIRYGAERADAERPGADDKAVARIDALRPRSVEIKALVGADVAAKLRVEAAARGTTLEALVAQMAGVIAADGLVNAVLGDR